MKLADIHNEWESDSTINVDLVKATEDIPILIAKYLRILSDERQRLKMYEQEQFTLLKKKLLHYKYRSLTKEEILEENWDFDPFNGVVVEKGDYDTFYNADTDIQKTVVRIATQKEKILVLKEIIDSIKWRHMNIKNIIDSRRFDAAVHGG